MRPVFRGISPQPGVAFTDHKKAAPHLKEAIGQYCSYCERPQLDALHVEHIQPNNLYPGMYGEWANYLLACPTCNGTKTNKDVALDDFLLPDRDNTFVAFRYTLDGKIEPAADLTDRQRQIALDTLDLTGLNTPKTPTKDRNGSLIRFDRISGRMTTRGEAMSALDDLIESPTDLVRRRIVATAKSTGVFSIWMDVFADYPEMRRRLIEAFPGTAEDCFNADTTPVSPRPQVAELAHSGKT